MKVTINIKLLNADFNQSIADDFYEGKESEDNIKFLWEDEFVVKENVTSFKIKNNAVYKIQGAFADNTTFSFDIPNVTIVECQTPEGPQQFVISKKLIKSTDKKENPKTGDITFSIILKDEIEYENPMDGVYIISSDFPKELKAASKTSDEEE